MLLKNTLFGRIFLQYQTKCGCIGYECRRVDKCLKMLGRKVNSYGEIFYLGNNGYLGRLQYKFIDDVKFKSGITILNLRNKVLYREDILFMSEPYLYRLRENAREIDFRDIPIDLKVVLRKKDVVR